VRAIQIQRLEGSRSPGGAMYFLSGWDGFYGSQGWCLGPCGSIADVECVEMGGLGAAWEGC
jgi:hypothetical protein